MDIKIGPWLCGLGTRKAPDDALRHAWLGIEFTTGGTYAVASSGKGNAAVVIGSRVYYAVSFWKGWRR